MVLRVHDQNPASEDLFINMGRVYIYPLTTTSVHPICTTPPFASALRLKRSKETQIFM